MWFACTSRKFLAGMFETKLSLPLLEVQRDFIPEIIKVLSGRSSRGSPFSFLVHDS